MQNKKFEFSDTHVPSRVEQGDTFPPSFTLILQICSLSDMPLHSFCFFFVMFLLKTAPKHNAEVLLSTAPEPKKVVMRLIEKTPVPQKLRPAMSYGATCHESKGKEATRYILNKGSFSINTHKTCLCIIRL